MTSGPILEDLRHHATRGRAARRAAGSDGTRVRVLDEQPQNDCSGGGEGHHRGAAARGDAGRRVRGRITETLRAVLSVTGVKAVQLHGDEKLADFEFIECPLLKSATLDDLTETAACLAGGNHVAARRGRSREARRHGRRSRLDQGGRGGAESQDRACRGPNASQRRRGDSVGAACWCGRGVGRGSVARRQGFREGGGVSGERTASLRGDCEW